MSIVKLFKIAIFNPLIVAPVKIVLFYILGLTGLRKWQFVFSEIEKLKRLNRVAFWKTVYFNFRSLPAGQAFLFPIHVYTGTEIISSEGSVEFRDCKVEFGMVRWGFSHTFRSQGKTKIQNRGLIVFGGEGKIFKGSEIVVFPTAKLTIGNSFFIGENVVIYCQENIRIAESVCISWLSDISDSDFHYCINVDNGEVYKKTSPIEIGAYNWIATRSSIKKGTKTPDHIMVASSGCVLSKDYTKFVKPFSVLGGCPAKIIKTGVSRIWHDEFANIEIFDRQFKEGKMVKLDKEQIDGLIHL